MKTIIKISILLCFLILSCHKTDSEYMNSNQWNMTRVEGINTGVINQTISLTVFYPTSSGCDIFDKFDLKYAKNNIVSIRAFGHTENSELCTQQAIEKSTTFEFTPASKGVFELRFTNKNNAYFTYNLIIN